MVDKHVVKTLLAGLVLMLAGSALVAHAAPPWGGLFDTRRVEADPKQPYPVKDDNGPWMIMTSSFSGLNADKQAHDLVIELRQRYKLEAYVYKKEFKLDDPNGDRGTNPLGAPRWQYKKFKNSTEIEQTAVLVGNYHSTDDPEAQATLKKLKYAEPDCLKPTADKPTSQTLAALRTIQKMILPDESEKKRQGPMSHAFVTTNPLLPADYYAPRKGIDELVLKINKDVTHSLLDCPGRYTVQVAHFTGNVIIDQRKVQAIESGKPMESSLTKAAEKAHILTEALREKGYEAYEFHDRYASIVTVGSFNSCGTPRPDGKIEINPQIHAIIKTFGGKPQEIPGLPPSKRHGQMVKQLMGISFDMSPIPVEVPKRSISRDLAQGL